MISNFSKGSSANKKFKKNGKDKNKNDTNSKYFKESSNKILENNINLEEDEEGENDDINDDNKEKSSNNLFKKPKIEESDKNIISINESNNDINKIEEIKNDLKKDMDVE